MARTREAFAFLHRDGGPYRDDARVAAGVAVSAKRGQCPHEADERHLHDVVDIRMAAAEHRAHRADDLRRDALQETRGSLGEVLGLWSDVVKATAGVDSDDIERTVARHRLRILRNACRSVRKRGLVPVHERVRVQACGDDHDDRRRERDERDALDPHALSSVREIDRDARGEEVVLSAHAFLVEGTSEKDQRVGFEAKRRSSSSRAFATSAFAPLRAEPM